MRFALGAMSLGTATGQAESFALLDRFAEAGGTMIDTANNYIFWVPGGTGDESELVVGAWMAARGNRESVVVGTKAGARPTVPGDLTLDSAEGLSAGVVRKAADDSLRRLRTDYVDVYWAHIEDRAVPLEETLGAFDELAGAGKIREAGASNLPVWRLERARELARSRGALPYTHLQLRHSYLRPRPGAKLQESAHVQVTEETLDYVRAEPDLTLWAYSALMSGAYTRTDRPMQEAYDHPGTTRRLAALDEVAGELGVTRNQVVLAWLMGSGVRPIVGVTRMEQLEEAIGAESVTLDDAQVTRLESAA
ncbi:aldo/keto reductase [Nonomuraea sp. NBC_01738]|uniref:aldo/keto reductase n=1 Tax=Nonomuraea sp. NBC_01738 TaxID=2976003 RepID=UPI002E1654EA|nr:aldo/keto reductase [Nonomuraea sp. NBC_01738]